MIILPILPLFLNRFDKSDKITMLRVKCERDSSTAISHAISWQKFVAPLFIELKLDSMCMPCVRGA